MDFYQLHDLLTNGKIDEAKAMVTRENAQTLDKWGDCVIWWVCAHGPDDPELLHHCLSLGCSLDGREREVHLAAFTQKVRLIRALFDLGLSINTKKWNGCSPIEHAIGNCKEKAALYLYDAGAKIEFKNEEEPSYLFAFRVKRGHTRACAIAVLCLKRCGSRVIGASNGNDVLRTIAWCVWATRGH